MQITPQNLVVALLIVTPGFIATLLAISWGSVEREISNGRILAISLVASLIIDSTLIWIVQVFANQSVTSPSTVDRIFFEPQFQPESVFLLLFLSISTGFLFAIGLIVDLHGRSRQWLWKTIRRHDDRSRDPWQPWEGTLRDANLIKVLTSNGDVLSGKVYEYSRTNKPRQLRLFEPEAWNEEEEQFKPTADKFVLLFEDDIERVYVLLSDDDVREELES